MTWPVHFGFVVILAVAVLALSYLVGQRHAEPVTGETYEGGIVTEGSAPTGKANNVSMIWDEDGGPTPNVGNVAVDGLFKPAGAGRMTSRDRSGIPYMDDTRGLSFGIQAEAWW